MENITTSDGFFDANLQNLPDFVQKLTADSLTHGNVSAVLENYGAVPGSSRSMSLSPHSTGSPGICRSVSLPTHVMEPMDPPPPPSPISPAARPKIKSGNEICLKHRVQELSNCSDGKMICDFTSFSTAFQSYLEDGWMIMKGCVQWNPVYG